MSGRHEIGTKKNKQASPIPDEPSSDAPRNETSRAAPPIEIGGPGGPEPTRYGDWERRGRCIDF